MQIEKQEKELDKFENSNISSTNLIFDEVYFLCEKALYKLENSNSYNSNFTFDDLYFTKEKRLEITDKQTAKFYYLLEQDFDGGENKSHQPYYLIKPLIRLMRMGFLFY